MTDHDHELLARMRDADPAASLPPVDPDRVARLLEDAMSHDTTTESRETGARSRSPLTWLVAAAAVALIAGVGIVALVVRDGDTASTPTAQGEPSVTELSMPATAAGRCMVPNAALLSDAEIAVDGEVASIDAGVVTLDVSHWYAGGPTDELRVDQYDADARSLIGAPVFEEGGRYLVAGSLDGDVMVCGFSGEYSEDLAGLYADAFGS